MPVNTGFFFVLSEFGMPVYICSLKAINLIKNQTPLTMKRFLAFCLLIIITQFATMANTGPPGWLPIGYSIEQSFVVSPLLVDMPSQDVACRFQQTPYSLYSLPLIRLLGQSEYTGHNRLTGRIFTNELVFYCLDAPVRKFLLSDIATNKINLYSDKTLIRYSPPSLYDCPLPFT